MNDDSAQPISIFLSRRTMLVGLTGAIGLAGVGSLLAGCSTDTIGAAGASPTVSKSSATVLSSPTPVPIGTTLFEYTGHSSLAMAVDWSPEGGRIVSGGFDNTAQVWDAMTGKHILVYRGHTGDRVNIVRWSPDGKYIASGGDGTIQVWDAVTGATIAVFGDTNGGAGALYSAAWSPDSKYIASGNEISFQVWDIMTGKSVSSYSNQQYALAEPLWSPDGIYLSYYLDAMPPTPIRLAIWDIASRKVASTLTIPEANNLDDAIDARHSAVAWSFDSQQIVYANRDGLVMTWNIPSGKQSAIFSQPGSGGWFCAGWSPDRKFIAAGSSNYNVQLWDTATAKAVYTLNTASYVQSLAWSPDSKYIASTQGNTVMVWTAA